MVKCMIFLLQRSLLRKPNIPWWQKPKRDLGMNGTYLNIIVAIPRDECISQLSSKMLLFAIDGDQYRDPTTGQGAKNESLCVMLSLEGNISAALFTPKAQGLLWKRQQEGCKRLVFSAQNCTAAHLNSEQLGWHAQTLCKFKRPSPGRWL